MGRWRFFPARQRTLGNGDDLRQFLFQRGGWRLGFEKQLGLGENAFAHHAVPLAPGLVECGSLPRGPRLRGEGLRHPLAMIQAVTRTIHWPGLEP